jgi:hypothetical protein
MNGSVRGVGPLAKMALHFGSCSLACVMGFSSDGGRGAIMVEGGPYEGRDDEGIACLIDSGSITLYTYASRML